MTQRIGIGKRIRFSIFERDGFTCQYCGKMPPDVMLHVDHIFPVCEGGSNAPENLRTSCQDCNSGKSGRVLNGNANPVDTARRAQEALESVETAKVFARSVKAREKTRQTATNQICESLQKEHCYKANVSSFILAVERFGPDKAFSLLDLAVRATARGSTPNEDSVFKYFNACAKRTAIEGGGT